MGIASAAPPLPRPTRTFSSSTCRGGSDSLPGAFLKRHFARDDLLPPIGALLGAQEFIPGSRSQGAPRSSSSSSSEDGVRFVVPAGVRWGSEPWRPRTGARTERSSNATCAG